MLAVGVLVPLEHGRIGRSWRHAVVLEELARYEVQRVPAVQANSWEGADR